MDIGRFCVGDDAFTYSHITARVEFKSPSSISFALGMYTHTRNFSHVGWIDVHHPCDGHIKTQLRIRITEKYLVFDQMKSIIQLTFDALGIPADETFEAHFIAGGQEMFIEEATDRTGMTDRFYS